MLASVIRTAISIGNWEMPSQCSRTAAGFVRTFIRITSSTSLLCRNPKHHAIGNSKASVSSSDTENISSRYLPMFCHLSSRDQQNAGDDAAERTKEVARQGQAKLKVYRKKAKEQAKCEQTERKACQPWHFLCQQVQCQRHGHIEEKDSQNTQ